MMRTWLRRARAARLAQGDDSGFTLPELIITMVILGFIMGAIGLTMVVVLKNTRSATERVTAGGSAQTLSLWFPGDVQSARGVGAYTDQRPTGCGDDQGSTNVITVQRSDVLQSPGDIVSYRLKQLGEGDYELWRVACTGGRWSKRVVVQGIADPATVKVSALLDGATDPVATLTPADVFTQLGLQLAVGAGDAIPLAVSGTPRSPGLLVPCQVTSATPNTVQRVNGGRLTAPAEFTVNTAGDCVDLSVTVQPDDLGGSVPLAPGPNTWTGTAPDVTWSIGPHEVIVSSGGTEAGRFTLDVLREPCEVGVPDMPTLEPGDVLRIGLDGFPTSPIGNTYVLNTTTSCDVDRVEIDMGDANVQTFPTTRLAAGRFRFSIAHDDGPWTAEDHIVRVLDGAAELGTVKLTAKISNCAVIGLTRVVLVTDGVPRNNPTIDVDDGRTLCGEPMTATSADNGLDVDLRQQPTGPFPGRWSEIVGGLPVPWPARTTVNVSVSSEGMPAGPAFPVVVDDCSLVTVTATIQTKDERPDGDLRFNTAGRCSFTPIVEFLDERGTPIQDVAEPDNGGGGPFTTDWRVRLPGGVRWDTQTLQIRVYDDALVPVTGFGLVRPSGDNGLVGTFLATGVPD